MTQACLRGWYREVFGEEWMKKNLFQRSEWERQARQSGENTPMWVEAAAGPGLSPYGELKIHQHCQNLKSTFSGLRSTKTPTKAIQNAAKSIKMRLS